MNLSKIFSYARFRTNTNSSTVTDAELLQFASEWHKRMVKILAEVRDGWELKKGYLPLASGSHTVSLPSDYVRGKRGEVHWSVGGDQYKVKFYDINEDSEPYDADTIDQNFCQEYPHAYLMADSIQLHPLPDADVSGGFWLWYVGRPDDFATVSEVPTFPEEFHRYMADYLMLDIQEMKGEMAANTARLNALDIDEQVRRDAFPRINDKPMRVRHIAEKWS